MNEQIEQHFRDVTKYKNKVKDLNSDVTSLESKLMSLHSSHKQLKTNFDNNANENDCSK